MDPLSITVAAGSLTATVFTLIKTVSAFVATARNTRVELDAVSRELISLQVCLEVLESDRRNGIIFSIELEASIHQVIVNIELCCSHIENMLAKSKAGHFGRTVRWALQQKEEMNQLRSSLETHKIALQMALQLNTISILIRETRCQSPPPSSPVQQANEMCLTTEQTNQENDGIAQIQQSNPALERIQEATADLSTSIRSAALKHGNLLMFAQQSCKFARESLSVIEHVDGISDIEVKVEQILRDPSGDSLSETNHAAEHVTPQDNPVERDTPDEAASSDIDPSDQMREDELQQLRAQWRHEWLTQLKDELVALGQQNDRPTPAMPDPLNITDASVLTTSLTVDDEIAELLSEVMTVTSWNGDRDDSSAVDLRPVPISRSTTRSDTDITMQRLQTKYESACRRVQMLVEQVAELETENSQLDDMHKQDVEQFEARLAKLQATPTLQIESLQHENEELRRTNDKVEATLQNLRARYERLQRDHEAQSSRAATLSKEVTHLQRNSRSMSQQIVRLEQNAASALQELANLKEIKTKYYRLLNKSTPLLPPPN